MPISPIAAGDGRVQHWTFTTDSGIFSLAGLQNSNIVLHLQDINNNNTLYVCTGTWAILAGGTTGLADFTPSAADLLSTNPLGKPGLYRVYPVVTLASGPVSMDGQMLQVVSEP